MCADDPYFQITSTKNKGIGGEVKRMRQLLCVPEYSPAQFLNSHKLVKTKLFLEENEKGL